MQRYSAVPVEAIQEHPAKQTSSGSKIDDVSLHVMEHRIPGWPSLPKTLAEAAPSWLSRLLPHVLLLLVPTASIGLAIAVLYYNNRAESQGGNTTKQAMAVTATLWPILFAAVLGPMLKAATLFRAERGAKLGVLEILSSSQTLVSTLRGCFALRILSVWPILLILAWSLSPIGGQSALRALELRQNTTTSEYPLANFPQNNLSAFENNFIMSGSGKMSLMGQYRALVDAVFSSQDVTLLHADNSSRGFESATQRAGGRVETIRVTRRDLWRNVRIPFLHTLPGYNSRSDDWITVPSDVIPKYSSLIGVPIRGFPTAQEANTTFIIQTNYQTLKCVPWIKQFQWLQTYNNSLEMYNLEDQSSYRVGLPNIRVDIMSATLRSGMRSLMSNYSGNAGPFERLTLVFMTPVSRANMTFCEIVTEYVDSSVECSRANRNTDLECSVQKMRHTSELSVDRNLTALHISEPSVLEKWLQNPPTTFGVDFSRTYDWSYEDIPLNVFSDRLAMVLNTNLLAIFNMTIMVGSDGTSIDVRDSMWGNTTGKWTEFTAPVYTINKTWFSLYFISAIVLLLCAAANIVLRSLIHVPDFFGSISALTRDSLFFDVPTPASGMDGTERARLLQDKWVMIQDVRPDGSVGRIAFSDDVGMVPLRRGRMYS